MTSSLTRAMVNELSVWRNPGIGEEPHAGKKVAVEFCFIGTALLAAIETVVFAALVVVTGVLFLATWGCVTRPVYFACNGFAGSATAVGLSVTGLVYNITRERLPVLVPLFGNRSILVEDFIAQIIAGSDVVPQLEGAFGGMTGCNYWLGTCLVYRLVYGDLRLYQIPAFQFPPDFLQAIDNLRRDETLDFVSPLTQAERAFLSEIRAEMPDSSLPGRLQQCYATFNASLASDSRRLGIVGWDAPRWEQFFRQVSQGLLMRKI